LKCKNPQRPGVMVSAPGIGGSGPETSLLEVDARTCQSHTNAKASEGPASSALTEYDTDGQRISRLFWRPKWDDEEKGKTFVSDDFKRKVWGETFCVSNRNTSLMIYPNPMNNTYLTGFRKWDNTKLFSSGDIYLTLHIKGRIPVEWAIFFNYKFILNGTIPLPEIQPEVFDEQAEFTDEIDISLTVFGVRQTIVPLWDLADATLMRYIPICQEPAMLMKGCFRVDYNIYQDIYSEYHLWYKIKQNQFLLAPQVSGQPYPYGDFNMSQGPWPMLDVMPVLLKDYPPGPWQQTLFPQKEWRPLPNCVEGNECESVPMVPSARYLHSAVLYTTWNFELNARPYLCNENPSCGFDCLSNFSCLGGQEEYFNQFFYFRSVTFRYDDGGDVPIVGIDNMDCPPNCCKDRRLCMRQRDVMGYDVAYDSVTMLIFGGKSYTHDKDPVDGRLIFHNCEQIHRDRLKKEWRSCTETISNDMWRYDVMSRRWEFIKPMSALDPTTLLPQGFPLARYAHSAAIVEIVDKNEPSSKKIWMYIYGGIGPQCDGGVCNDIWKYEVAFAPQAYYPKFPDGDWNRGNKWYKLQKCPYGGRYRHEMVTNSQNEYIYIFGGQYIGGYSHQLLKYKIQTDVWDDMAPFGRRSLTRMLYDHQGIPRIMSVNTDEFNDAIDVDCTLAWRFDGSTAHCQMCPTCRLATGDRDDGAKLPDERGDFAMLPILDNTPGATDDRVVIFGGFRTTWGMQRDRNETCNVQHCEIWIKGSEGPPGFRGDYTAAWDGELSTFVNYEEKDGGWTQAVFNAKAIVYKIRWFPRPFCCLERYFGGRFYGVTEDGANDLIATITHYPEEWVWQTMNLTSTGVFYKKVRYEAPVGSNGNIAEIKVYTDCEDETATAAFGYDAITTTTLPPPPPPDWAVDLGPTAPPPGSVDNFDTLQHPPTTATTSTTVTTEGSIFDTDSGGSAEAAAPVDSGDDTGDDSGDDSGGGISSGSIEGNPSQPTGQESPGEAVWVTGAPNVRTTTVTTTTTATTSTSTSSTTITTTTTSATTTTILFKNVVRTLAPTPEPTEAAPPPPNTTTTTTNTTFTTSTTTTLEHQRPVVRGKVDEDDDDAVNMERDELVAPASRLEGPCANGKKHQYYFDDVWIYETGINQWGERKIHGKLPPARRGHKLIARGARTSDVQLILVGGHNQDTPYDDMWVLNLNRQDPEERVWTRIDAYFSGERPPALSYHSMLYSEVLNRFIVFGGLTWDPTDQQETDSLRNIDRRCMKEAQGLPELYNGVIESEFLVKMRKQCLRDDMRFCCIISQNAAVDGPWYPPDEYIGETRVRTDEGYLNLTALSILCRTDCETKFFFSEFYPKFVEGVYTFKIDECIRNCSGNGFCDLSQCVCEPEWYGVDCSLPRCPGSACYTHPRSKEQFCVDCSQHGRCMNGVCQCFTGWGLEDCSAMLCEENCSSTPYETRGVCVEDFPVHQCSCLRKWSGPTCSELMCINSCSGRGKCVDGKCFCDDKYYGEDCSVFIFSPT